MSSPRGKWLKRLGLIAVVLLLAIVGVVYLLWDSGGEMATYQAEIVIAAPPERVFSFLVEPDRLKQWMDGLVESKPLTEGGPRVGARSEEIVEGDGRRMVVLTEIEQLEVNRLLVVKLQNEMFDAVSRYELEPSGAATRAKHRFEVSYKGMARFMAPLIGGAVKKKLEGDMQKLKEVAERGGP